MAVASGRRASPGRERHSPSLCQRRQPCRTADVSGDRSIHLVTKATGPGQHFRFISTSKEERDMAVQAVTLADGRILNEDVVREFAGSLRGPLLADADPGYDDARTVQNGLIDRRPALIARCSGPADVIQAVNFARDHGLLVSVKGGGHNVAGNATNDGGLLIDLTLMRGVHVDAKDRVAHVQGGATWGDLDRETQVFGLATPGGVVSTTGVAGLTLHGGMGHLRSKFGLSIDNLLSVDIVTADGQLRTASPSENEDLFWAVRGAGSNFGVVTSFEFRAHPVGPEVMVGALFYPLEDITKLL